MAHTGMVGMVVCGGDKERDVQSTAAVLNDFFFVRARCLSAGLRS